MPSTAKVQQYGKMVPILQEATNIELTVSQHYWNRARYWKVQGIPKLAEMYGKEADEERGHAALVAERMLFLGQSPVLLPGQDKPVAGALRQQFEEDLAGEVAVADQYTEWVQTAMMEQDFVTMDVMKLILEQTEEHALYLQDQLRLMDTLTDANYIQTWM